VLNHLIKLRYLTVVIVIFAALHGIAFLIMGARAALRAYAGVLRVGHEQMARPGLELLHSLDFFFVAMVLIVLALGIAKLFLVDPAAVKDEALPAWLRIDDIGELKVLLWETILTTMLIIALSDMTEGLFAELAWTVLLTPAAILLLAASLHLMKKRA
jgi:uncharacterized membrane protein YqhA